MEWDSPNCRCVAFDFYIRATQMKLFRKGECVKQANMCYAVANRFRGFSMTHNNYIAMAHLWMARAMGVN